MDPTRLVRDHLTASPQTRPLFVVGAGKAAARMAAGVEAALGSERLDGIVVTAPGCEAALRRIRIAIGSHPLPDRASVAAANEILRAVGRAAPDATLLALISGGASSLLALPRPPVTLADKIAANRLLLASGAAIEELNTVRKHLSAIKGGGVLRAAGGRTVTTLILSDVIGDDPSVIGSAPTMPDPSTYADAIAVLRRYALLDRVPAAVRDLLEAGARGETVETVKPGDPEARRATATVIGSNATARRAAAIHAARLGYEPVVEDTPLSGDTAAAARRWAPRLTRRPGIARWCVIAGGETTVVVRGAGRGGRNQEFALAAAAELEGASVVLLSAGTDGIDGPTDAAGAFADGSTLARARERGLDQQKSLADNDAYAFFDRLGDLFRTGPTGTNVMDLKIAVGVGSAS
ncbi:DUF4147 domain-containing protein [bacterium]|nr:DUF4147 domain-containing protein [bacterium]